MSDDVFDVLIVSCSLGGMKSSVVMTGEIRSIMGWIFDFREEMCRLWTEAESEALFRFYIIKGQKLLSIVISNFLGHYIFC